MLFENISDTNVDVIKQHIKPLTVKSPAPIVVSIETNDLASIKNCNEITAAVVQLTKLARTDKNKVAVLLQQEEMSLIQIPKK